MTSYIHRLDSLKDVRTFLGQDNVTAKGNYRIRIDPNAGPLPSKTSDKDGDPIPDIFAEALKLTQEGNDEPYYLVTNLMDPDFPSFLIAESFVLGTPEPSALSKVRTTDPFGALNYEKKFSRAVEHHHVRALLAKEEELRGSIGIYQIEISQDMILPGINPTTQGKMEAKMVINMNQPMFIVDNIMDNYVRPDMVTVDFLATEPVLLKSITPNADKAAEDKTHEIEREKRVKTNNDLFEARLFKHESTIRNRHIDDIQYLNSTIGHIMDVPPVLTKDNKGVRIPNLLGAAHLAGNVRKFEQTYNSRPEISPNNDLNLSEKIRGLGTQLELENFRSKNGFYLKLTELKDKMQIEVYDYDDAMIAHAIVDWDDKSEELVTFNVDDGNDFEERLPIYRLQTGESGSVYEIGKLLEDEGALDDLWYHLPSLAFMPKWDDLPGTEFASIEKESIVNIEEIDAALLMHELENNQDVIALVSAGVKKLRQELELKVSKQTEYAHDQVMGI